MPRQDREAAVRSGRFRLSVAETGEPIAPDQIPIVAKQTLRTYRILNSGENEFNVNYADPANPATTLTHALAKNRSLDIATAEAISVSRADKTVAIEGVVEAVHDRSPIRPGRFKGTTKSTILRNIKESDYRFFNGGKKALKIWVDSVVLPQVIKDGCSMDLRINGGVVEIGTENDKAYVGAYEVLRREGRPRTGRFAFQDAADQSMIINLSGDGEGKAVYRVINSGVNPFAVKTGTGTGVDGAIVDPLCSIDFECAQARKIKIEAVAGRTPEGGTPPGTALVYPIAGVYEMIKPL